MPRSVSQLPMALQMPPYGAGASVPVPRTSPAGAYGALVVRRPAGATARPVGVSLPWTTAAVCLGNPVAAAVRHTRGSKKIVGAVCTRGCEQHTGRDVTQAVWQVILSGGVETWSLPTTYLSCSLWRKANNFRGLLEFLPYYVATIKLAYTDIFLLVFPYI